MTKRIRLIATITLAIVLSLGSTVSVYAAEPSTVGEVSPMSDRLAGYIATITTAMINGDNQTLFKEAAKISNYTADLAPYTVHVSTLSTDVTTYYRVPSAIGTLTLINIVDVPYDMQKVWIALPTNSGEKTRQAEQWADGFRDSLRAYNVKSNNPCVYGENVFLPGDIVISCSKQINAKTGYGVVEPVGKYLSIGNH